MEYRPVMDPRVWIPKTVGDDGVESSGTQTRMFYELSRDGLFQKKIHDLLFPPSKGTDTMSTQELSQHVKILKKSVSLRLPCLDLTVKNELNFFLSTHGFLTNFSITSRVVILYLDDYDLFFLDQFGQQIYINRESNSGIHRFSYQPIKKFSRKWWLIPSHSSEQLVNITDPLGFDSLQEMILYLFV